MILHLLNASIMPSGADGLYMIQTISPTEAKYHYNNAKEVVSHIGHQGTADLLTLVLGKPIPVDRSPWDGTGSALICAMSFRAEEGHIYSAEEMAQFLHEGKIVFRRCVRYQQIRAL